MEWAELETTYPGVADYVTRLVHFIGFGFLEFAAFGLAITWSPYRKGDQWA